MQEITGGALQRIPSLVSLSTIAMATDFQYECPSGMYSLLCAFSGSCTLTTPERSIRLAGSRMAFISGNLRYQMKDGTPDLSVGRLDFSTSCGGICSYGLAQVEAFFPQTRTLMEGHGTCTEFEDSKSAILSSLRNLNSFASLPAEQRELQTTLTLCAILAGISSCMHGENSRRRCYNPHVRKAMDFIDENYMFGISAEDIARASGVHVGHLHRIFPQETGMRIGEYLTGLRIEKAKSLLMHTDISSASIAGRTGIGSQQYFCRLFKKETGMTPQEYRKSYSLTCHYDPEFYPAPIPGDETGTGGTKA